MCQHNVQRMNGILDGAGTRNCVEKSSSMLLLSNVAVLVVVLLRAEILRGGTNATRRGYSIQEVDYDTINLL